MSVSILLDQAQAKIYAHAGDWDHFTQQAALVAKQRSLLHYTQQDGTHWFVELWFELALRKNTEQFAEYSQWLLDHRSNGVYALPTLSSLMDMASREPQLQWILDRPDWRDLLVASAHVPVPNKDWRSSQKVVSNIVPTYTAWMLAQPQNVQDIQKEYLEKYGVGALTTKTLLYHAICAYGTPTKNQVRAAALAHTPIYDMVRLEEHYPGFSGLRAACEGMDMKKMDMRTVLSQFMDGIVREVPMAIPEHGFEHI